MQGEDERERITNEEGCSVVPAVSEQDKPDPEGTRVCGASQDPRLAAGRTSSARQQSATKDSPPPKGQPVSKHHQTPLCMWKDACMTSVAGLKTGKGLTVDREFVGCPLQDIGARILLVDTSAIACSLDISTTLCKPWFLDDVGRENVWPSGIVRCCPSLAKSGRSMHSMHCDKLYLSWRQMWHQVGQTS